MAEVRENGSLAGPMERLLEQLPTRPRREVVLLPLAQPEFSSGLSLLPEQEYASFRLETPAAPLPSFSSRQRLPPRRVGDVAHHFLHELHRAAFVPSLFVARVPEVQQSSSSAMTQLEVSP